MRNLYWKYSTLEENEECFDRIENLLDVAIKLLDDNFSKEIKRGKEIKRKEKENEFN